jgi:hypothetical protein
MKLFCNEWQNSQQKEASRQQPGANEPTLLIGQRANLS